MSRSVTRKIIDEHLEDGSPEAGQEIALRIDQTLTQDATGTLVMLAFEAMGIPRVRTQLSAQYVDHNLLQTDFRNADDHAFLRSACRKHGVLFSRPGNGVSHPVHMERCGRPGATLLGSDSHTPAAGALGMLAMGAGGLEVAGAMAGRPYRLRMPKIRGIQLNGTLPDWVSAKDIILEMLRRHDVDGGLGQVMEYHGAGLASLSAMDRHVIANMGTELGATSTVFPADNSVRDFLRVQGRESEFRALPPDPGAAYDREETIELGSLEPMIALPGSPGNVVPVGEVAGRPISQAYIGSSANPGLRDFAVPALMMDGRQAAPGVSFDVNPTSRSVVENLIGQGLMTKLVRAGARIHQAGCNGCIGMGQAPATDTISLRTVPRNFPGRSGSRDDQVYLCSPETAAASALTGVITDPRELDMTYPRFEPVGELAVDHDALELPADPRERIEVVKGPNIVPLPELEALPEELELPVLLALGDDISTDEIMPAGARVLPFRSNIPRIAEFVFDQIEEGFAQRARQEGDFCVVAGDNYGQGSSREHAALAPRYLGLRAVIATGFARIHRQNLINYGVLPLEFENSDDRERLDPGARIQINGLATALEEGHLQVHVEGSDEPVICRLKLAPRERKALLAGGAVNAIRAKEAR